jgi:hypothetical protein
MHIHNTATYMYVHPYTCRHTHTSYPFFEVNNFVLERRRICESGHDWLEATLNLLQPSSCSLWWSLSLSLSLSSVPLPTCKLGFLAHTPVLSKHQVKVSKSSRFHCDGRTASRAGSPEVEAESEAAICHQRTGDCWHRKWWEMLQWLEDKYRSHVSRCWRMVTGWGDPVSRLVFTPCFITSLKVKSSPGFLSCSRSVVLCPSNKGISWN